MTKIVALLAFQNEEKYLPGFFAHLRPYVSEFIVLDDASSDGSAEISRSQPDTVLLKGIDGASHTPHYYEIEHRRILLEAALAAQADWVLACDADERYESRFLEDLPTLIVGKRDAYALWFRELWDRPDRFRIDGIWGTKARFVLFPCVSFTEYHPVRSQHTRWPPPNISCPDENILNYNLYHFGSLSRGKRVARMRKWLEIDPEARYQPKIGYSYLSDEAGLVVREIEPEHRYQILPEDAHLFANC